MDQFDLNLLRIVVAVAEEGSVSRAAEKLGISQPSASLALGKLRRQLGNELFVRSAGGMAPTPRAVQVIALARELLGRVRDELLEPRAFDPATTTTSFSVALSDIGEMVFLPKLLEAIQARAPLATLTSSTLPASEVAAALESGKIDLAIGYFPDLQRHTLFQQRLFSHGFTCLLRSGHPITGERLTMPQFLALGHAVVRAEGRSQEVFERHLDKKGIRRRVVLSTPHFLSIPFMIANSDLVVTVPQAVGASLAGFADVRLVRPPLTIPRFDLKQHWHRKFHDDARHQWLRSLVVELFKDDRRW